MKKVYYKGHPYEFNVHTNNDQRIFTLYQNNVVVHEVAQHDLDINSIVSLVLEEYYNELTQRDMKPVINAA
jgi:hypothetical protein